MGDIRDLEQRLIAAQGDPQMHAQIRQEIRAAGFPHLADELDRIAATDPQPPTQEDTDRLTAQPPADRTGWDGTPLSDADRRFFDLRDSGYRGPIDQDGYAATSGEDAAILRGMAEQRGEDTSWWGTEPPGPHRADDDTDAA